MKRYFRSLIAIAALKIALAGGVARAAGNLILADFVSSDQAQSQPAKAEKLYDSATVPSSISAP